MQSRRKNRSIIVTLYSMQLKRCQPFRRETRAPRTLHCTTHSAMHTECTTQLSCRCSHYVTFILPFHAKFCIHAHPWHGGRYDLLQHRICCWDCDTVCVLFTWEYCIMTALKRLYTTAPALHECSSVSCVPWLDDHDKTDYKFRTKQWPLNLIPARH